MKEASDGLRPSCIQCDKEFRREHRQQIAARTSASRKTDKFREHIRQYKAENRDRILAQRRKRHSEIKERENLRSRAYKQDHKKELAQKHAAYNLAHPEGNRFRRSLRRAAEKQATPRWADRNKMLQVYEQAVRMTRITGIPHHVDHIYPLQSKMMCGLHCEANLQIVPAIVNQSKKNRVLDETAAPLCCAWPSVQAINVSSVAVL